MGRLPNQQSWSHIMLRAWIIIWLLAVPLFHVHPEADHHHGDAGHVHGGTVHTVFSPDLEGEFGNYQDTTVAVHQRPASQVIVSGHHASDYTELGFSFVSDSTDRNLPKPLVTSVFLIEPPAHLALTAIRSVIQDLTFSHSLPLLTRNIPSRAPPSLLV
ncbi:hypothetical protein ACO9S2_01675 [Nitrospira sp. NS4]|uniref:hypothetical protein n=1 Tax=Nitrospira sp. NS4 TaxID=3414498 RepID=UPI003C30447B